MTEQDVQAAQDAALGRYMRLKTARAVALDRLNRVGKEMSAFASDLCEGGRRQRLLGTQAPPWLDLKVILELLADVSNAESEMGTARDHAIFLGVAIGKDL